MLLPYDPATLKWVLNISVITFKSQTHGNRHRFQIVNRTFTAFLKTSADTHLKLLGTKCLWSCPKMKFKNLKNVCDEGNEQRSLEGEDSPFTPPHLIWLHFILKPPLTVPATTDRRWGLLPLRKHIPPEQMWRTRCSMLLGCSWQGACVELVAEVCIYEQYLTSSSPGPSQADCWLDYSQGPKHPQQRRKVFHRIWAFFKSKPFCFDIGVFNSNNHSLWIFVKTHLDD